MQSLPGLVRYTFRSKIACAGASLAATVLIASCHGAPANINDGGRHAVDGKAPGTATGVDSTQRPSPSGVDGFRSPTENIRFDARSNSSGAGLDAGPFTGDAPPGIGRPLDVLLVVQNTPTMGAKQRAFRQGFGALVSALQARVGGVSNAHFGVVSSDVGAFREPIPGLPSCDRANGDRGDLMAKPECGLTSERFVITDAVGKPTNAAGSVEAAVGCLAEIGTDGCKYEQPFESMTKALDTDYLARNVNKGFLRENSDLVIIFLADQDDCSAGMDMVFYTTSGVANYESQTRRLRCALAGHLCNRMPIPGRVFQAPLAACEALTLGQRDGLIGIDVYKKFIRSLSTTARGTRRVLVAALVGWPSQADGATYSIGTIEFQGKNYLSLDPVCRYGAEEAGPGLRFKALIDAFGAQGRLESVCSNDLRPALTRIGAFIATAP